MTPVSVFAALISIVAIGLSWRNMTRDRFVVIAILLIFHISISVFYMLYSRTNQADAPFYYYDPYNFANGPWGFGTIFVVKLVNLLKIWVEASYLDCFLIFQAIGFGGIMILVRVFAEIQAKTNDPDPGNYWLFLFLPSLNFWTAALGKDAPLFFAVSLAVWSALNIRKRALYFCIALGLMVLFRAHIALMAAVALAVAACLEPSISLGRKAALLTLVALGLSLVVGAVRSTFDVDVTSVSSITTFLDEKNTIYSTVAGGTSVHGSFAFSLFSLLFRPFFFDASGTLGLMASVENLGVVCSFIYFVSRWRDVIYLCRRIFFLRFALIYAVILLVALSFVYYNVGLGLRQRVMAYPMMFSIIVALASARRARSVPSVSQPQMAISGTGGPAAPSGGALLESADDRRGTQLRPIAR